MKIGGYEVRESRWMVVWDGNDGKEWEVAFKARARARDCKKDIVRYKRKNPRLFHEIVARREA